MPSAVARIVSRIRPQPSAGTGEAVPPRVLLGWYLRKGLGPVLRGTLRAPFLGAAKFPFFLGAGTRIAYGSKVQVGRGVQIGARCVVNAYSTRGILLEDGVTIRENGWINCSSHPSAPGVGLRVGRSTYIGPGVVLGVGGEIRIGAGCQIGANVTLIAENHATVDGRPSAHEVERLGISVGDGSWLGHGVTVVDGVTLGAGCVVGAGAVVTKSFPAGSRIAGVPARLLGGAAETPPGASVPAADA